MDFLQVGSPFFENKLDPEGFRSEARGHGEST